MGIYNGKDVVMIANLTEIPVDLVQEGGTSETKVMSQKAVTEALKALKANLDEATAHVPKATVRGNPVVIKDISPVTHSLKVKVIGTEDPTTTPVVRYNPNTDSWDEFRPNADGTVDGITSFYPNMELRVDSAVNEIEVEYNRDIAHVLGGYANAPKATASGNILLIEDISPITHPMSVKVRGVADPTSVKVCRSGINALPYPFYDTTKTINGITFTDNGDGTVTANGTATAPATFWCSHRNQLKKFTVPKRSITLSGCPDGGSASTYCIRATMYNGNTYVDEHHAYTEPKTYTFAGEFDSVQIGLHIYAGTAVSNLVFKPMVEICTATGVFVPFIAYDSYEVDANGVADGVSSVAPMTVLATDDENANLEVEYNRDVRVLCDEIDKLKSKSLDLVQTVGQATDVVMSQKAVCDAIGIKQGKNLFNKNDPDIIRGSRLISNGEVQTVTTGNYPTTPYYISGYVPVEAGKIYSITKVPATADCACFYDASKTFVSSVTMSSINSAGYKVTIPDGVSYMRITDRQTNLDVQQIEEGEKITAYEAYCNPSPIVENTMRIQKVERDIDALSTKVVKDYETNEGVVIDKLNNLDEWKVSKYPLTDNPSEVVEETTLTKYGKALKFKSRVKPSQLAVYKRVSYDFTNVKKTFSFWVYHDRVYENCFVRVQLYNGAYGDANSAYCTVYSNKLYKGWHLVTFNEVDFVATDGFDWSNIQSIAVVAGIPASGEDEYNVIINDLRVGKEWKPSIIFRFDDGLKGVYQNAEPALRERGMSGIVYCNTLFNERADNGEIDPVTSKPYSEGYCTTAELMEMYNKGFDIGNHSRSHLTFVDVSAHYDYTDIDDTETKRTSVLYQVKKGQNWLIDKGFVKSARHFAVPGGHDTVQCQQALIDCGVLTSGNSVHDDFTPNNNLHKIPAWGIANTTTVDQIKTWISDAVTRERTVVLMFHDILNVLQDVADGGYSEIRYQYLTSDFEAILDWIVEQGWAGYVTNMSDWYEGLNR